MGNRAVAVVVVAAVVAVVAVAVAAVAVVAVAVAVAAVAVVAVIDSCPLAYSHNSNKPSELRPLSKKEEQE